MPVWENCLCHISTFKSLMCRYSSTMAFDFFSTSASVRAGLGSEARGGVGALSRLTAKKTPKILSNGPVWLHYTSTLYLNYYSFIGTMYLGDLCQVPCLCSLGLCFLCPDFLCPCFLCPYFLGPCHPSCLQHDAQPLLWPDHLLPFHHAPATLCWSFFWWFGYDCSCHHDLPDLHCDQTCQNDPSHLHGPD